MRMNPEVHKNLTKAGYSNISFEAFGCSVRADKDGKRWVLFEDDWYKKNKGNKK